MAKSKRNKTIETSVEEGMEYLDRCLRPNSLKSNMDDLLDKTIAGDLMEVADLIPDNTANLIIADPPYNLSKKFDSRNFTRIDDKAYEKYTREWLSAIDHILKADGSIYVCCDWNSSLIVGKVLAEFYTVRNRITWQREKGRGASRNWKNSMEDIWFATRSDDYTFNLDAVRQRRQVIAPYRKNGKPKDWEETPNGNYRDTCPSNFWDDITVPFWSMAENTAHPTQKPEKLIAKLILSSSNENDVIFDPFLGSGTTSVTAKKLGRHYLGVEREDRFCIWAEQRLELAEISAKIQGYEDGVFWERNTNR
ncbi:MAG: site-specific DNA-methyltransferase [Bacillota bacterium]|nr:site-specific DNA-methyltransferase [Bacillota bacterium]